MSQTNGKLEKRGAIEIEDRIAALDARIFQFWARRREANLQLGRAFNELKEVLGHGKWKAHFEKVFAPQGISLRTAERYMKRAKKEDTKAKSDKLSNFEEATDPGASQIKEATEKAAADVAAASNHSKQARTSRLYHLPLHMTDKEKESTDALRRSSEWPRAERQIVRLLRRLWTECDDSKNSGRAA